MMEEQADEFFYLTAMNEAYAHPNQPDGIREDLIKGLYRLSSTGRKNANAKVRLLGSGAILPEVEAAAKMLQKDWGVAAEVFSATSYSELERDARETERRNRLNPLETPQISHVAKLLAGDAPVVAASDYVRAVPQLIAPYVDAPFAALGTDGFGRSDTRGKLRSFFEVDRTSIVLAALDRLSQQGKTPRKTLADAIKKYGVDASAPTPWTV